MNESLKCGPFKKCVKRAQDMFHKGLFPGLTEAQVVDTSGASEGAKSEEKVVREAKEAEPQPGPSNQPDENQRLTRQGVLIHTLGYWWTIAELQTLQHEDQRTLSLYCRPS